MIDPETILFAIQAGVRLGKKINEVLVDATRERPLVLPLGDLFGDVVLNKALAYFRNHPELEAPGGPYEGFSNEEKLKAYKTILALEERVRDTNGLAGDVPEILGHLHRFEQLKKGFGGRPALQRILGTVVEIGIDYFAANPQLLGGDSNAKKVLRSFIVNLDDVDFAESTPGDLVKELLLASLKTLDSHGSLLDDNKRAQALLGGIVKSLIEDFDSLASAAGKVRRGEMIKRIGSSIVRGGASAFTENLDLFLPKDDRTKELVRATLSQVVAGIDGQEDLFTNESLELVFKSALQTAAEHADALTNNAFLQDLIRRTVGALTAAPGQKLFGEETIAAVLGSGLEALRDHPEILGDTNDPETRVLAATVSALAGGLTSTLAGGGTVKDLLSNKQLIALARLAFFEVGKNTELLLGDKLDQNQKSLLAQTIGSLAQALGEHPENLVTGDGFVRLVKLAIENVVLNADKLINVKTANVRTNVLFRIVQETVSALQAHPDPRGLIHRDFFLTVLERVLPVVSANLDGFLAPGAQPVAETIRTALDLGSAALQNRVNGGNLPDLIVGLLRQVLRRELGLNQAAAVEVAADVILRAA